MDPEDTIITQMGLILTQLRYTRRAMEDIERSTARYGGVAFATALQAGPHFGEPPLLAGALKVHVVNINDLAPGSGFGAFLEGLLGGTGRFFGTFLGGLAGGAVGTIALFLGQLSRLASTIDRILDRLGLRGTAPTLPAATATPPPSPTSAAKGPNLTTSLLEIRRTVQALTGLFTAAVSGPEAAARAAGGAPPQTLAGQQWLDALAGVYDVLQSIARVVDGLILAIPMVIGVLAVVVAHLNDIKLGILDLLQFILRNVFLLRGTVLVTIYDTISALASVGASVLGIVGAAIERVLAAIFRIIGQLVAVAVEAIRFLANGIQNTTDALLRWLVGAVGAVLTFLGDTRIFRVIVHVIQNLPAVLPPLLMLIRGPSARLTPAESEALKTAAARTVPGPTTPGGLVRLPPSPNLTSVLTPASEVSTLAATVTTTSRSMTREAGEIFGATERALRQLTTTVADSAASGEEGFNRGFRAHQENVARRADALASALAGAQRAAAEGPQTGMEAIARAYEGWLAGGGLQTILQNITRHFQGTATTGPEALRSVPGRIAAEAAQERPRATVEIQEVVIEIAPPAEPPTAGPAAPAEPQSLLERLLEELDDLYRRGYRPEEGLPLAFT